MSKIFYLIDTENAQWEPLLGVLNDPDEKMILYHSPRFPDFKITYDQLKTLSKKEFDIEIEETDNGEKNSLDFQLIATLGLTVEKENTYVIVANDKGYDAAIKKFVERGYVVRRMNPEEIKNQHKSLTEKVRIERSKEKNNEIAAVKRKVKEKAVEEAKSEDSLDDTNSLIKSLIANKSGEIEVTPIEVKPINLAEEVSVTTSATKNSEMSLLLQEDIKNVKVKEVGEKNRTKNKYYKAEENERKKVYGLIDETFGRGSNKCDKNSLKKIKRFVIDSEICENLGNNIMNVIGNQSYNKKRIKKFFEAAEIKDIFFKD